MQYGKLLQTKLTITEDWATSLSSTQYRANLNSIGFNMTLIERQDPQLAADIIGIYRRASKLNPTSEPAVTPRSVVLE